MESSLQSTIMRLLIVLNSRFNPCFNGIFSSISYLLSDYRAGSCFNPCFNGIFSSIESHSREKVMDDLVSILVLMESSLQYMCHLLIFLLPQCFSPCFNGIFSSIVYEYIIRMGKESFNPCFNGIFSSIVYEDIIRMGKESFNPCFNGIFSSIFIGIVCDNHVR